MQNESSNFTFQQNIENSLENILVMLANIFSRILYFGNNFAKNACEISIILLQKNLLLLFFN